MTDLSLVHVHIRQSGWLNVFVHFNQICCTDNKAY